MLSSESSFKTCFMLLQSCQKQSLKVMCVKNRYPDKMDLNYINFLIWNISKAKTLADFNQVKCGSMKSNEQC